MSYVWLVLLGIVNGLIGAGLRIKYGWDVAIPVMLIVLFFIVIFNPFATWR